MLRQNKAPVPIYVLFLCNEWKEFGSMRLAMATTEPERLRKSLKKLIRSRDVEYGGRPEEIDSLELLSLNNSLSYAFISSHDDGVLEV